MGQAEWATRAAGGAGDLQDANSLDSVDLTVEFSTHPISSQEGAKQKLSPTGLHGRKCKSTWWKNTAVAASQCRSESQLPLHRPGSGAGHQLAEPVPFSVMVAGALHGDSGTEENLDSQVCCKWHCIPGTKYYKIVTGLGKTTRLSESSLGLGGCDRAGLLGLDT